MSDPDFSANNCFVCGPDNPIGLKISFHMDDNVCRGSFTSLENHMGYKDITHGGIIFSLLDDVMANWLFLQNKVAQTAQCDLRYRKPLPIHTKVNLEGRCIKQKGKVTFMHGKVISDATGDLIAESHAKFMIISNL